MLLALAALGYDPQRSGVGTLTPSFAENAATQLMSPRQLQKMLLYENSQLRSQVHVLERTVNEYREREMNFKQQMAPHMLIHRHNASTALTRERLQAVGGAEKQVILTFVNTARLDFAVTWVAHVRRLGLTNWMVGATDPGALQILRATDTPCFDLHTTLPTGEWSWGSRQFKSLGPTKVRLIQTALQWGLELVITDIDALVLRSPFPFMARWPDAAFLTTTDHLSNSTADDGLERDGAIHSAFNIGYMFFRPAALPLVDEWLSVLEANPVDKWDQGEFNRLARLEWSFGPLMPEGEGITPLSDERLFRAYHGRVVGGVLPLGLFCGGHSYFVAQLPQRRGVEPYSIHTTFQYGGAPGKRHRLREAMVWEDEPAYYDPPSGMLRYEPHIPASLLRPEGGMRAQGHIALVEHQLGQIGNALALALRLGRKLILPPIVCGYDKAWYALDKSGVFSGAPSWELPIYHCPLDHVLEPSQLNPNNAEGGTIREYSLLRNLRTPAHVLASHAATAINETCGKGELLRLHTEFADTKVLTITNLAAIPSLYEHGTLGEPTRLRLERSFNSVSGSWCCSPSTDKADGMPNSYLFHLPLLPPTGATLQQDETGGLQKPTSPPATTTATPPVPAAVPAAAPVTEGQEVQAAKMSDAAAGAVAAGLLAKRGEPGPEEAAAASDAALMRRLKSTEKMRKAAAALFASSAATAATGPDTAATADTAAEAAATAAPSVEDAPADAAADGDGWSALRKLAKDVF